MDIYAGIVLYNPDIPRLKENINAILPQVKKVVLVDNSSTNIQAIEELAINKDSLVLIKNDTNKGISHALNQITTFSSEEGGDWVLTLDQDSVVPLDMISLYKEHLTIPNLGILTCRILDRNAGDMNKSYSKDKDVEDVNYCITSASLTNVSAVLEVGGYDEGFFIDSVDHDICLRLRKHGYRIVRDNRVVLLHEIGQSRIVHFLGKNQLILNHSPFRHYYIVRNHIIMMKKHGQGPHYLRLVVKHLMLTIIFEDRKASKTVAMLRGLVNGLLYKVR